MKLLPEQTLWRCLELHPASVIDGDTLRLRDPDPEAWGAQQARLRRTASGEVVLRLAALDAPESRYPGGPAQLDHQPPESTALSIRLLQRELEALQSSRLMVRLCAVDGYGRALVLVWAADAAPRNDGDCDATCLADSLNARLLACGASFPDFHNDLPRDWITQLAAPAHRARLAGQGLWPLDRSISGVALGDCRSLAERHLVLPRLFRRIADFWRQQGATRMADPAACFREFLEQRERTLRLREGGPVRPFAEWVEVRAGRCRLTGHVENFLYQSCSPDKKMT